MVGTGVLERGLLAFMAIAAATTVLPHAPAGSITFDEWISFWVNVLAHGYDCDDLEEEVEMLLEGNSWVDFNDGRSTGNDAGGPS
eukprot:22221-Prymnesium_polylepis.2